MRIDQAGVPKIQPRLAGGQVGHNHHRSWSGCRDLPPASQPAAGEKADNGCRGGEDAQRGEKREQEELSRAGGVLIGVLICWPC